MNKQLSKGFFSSLNLLPLMKPAILIVAFLSVAVCLQAQEASPETETAQSTPKTTIRRLPMAPEPVEVKPGKYLLVQDDWQASIGSYPRARDVVVAEAGEGKFTIEFPDSGEKVPFEVQEAMIFFAVVKKGPEGISTRIYTARREHDGILGKVHFINPYGGHTEGKFILQPRE